MARCHHCRRGYVDADPRRKFGTCDDCANELRPDPPAAEPETEDEANNREILETWPAADFEDLNR